MKKLLTISGALVALSALLPAGAIAGPHNHGSHQPNYSSHGHGHGHGHGHAPVRYAPQVRYAPPVRYVSRGNYQNYRYAQQQHCNSSAYRPSQYRPVYNSYRGYSRPGVTFHFGGGSHSRR
ncbi:MAG TPA: hypothetical protein PK648_04825 [Verrucomicrobiales bacterium]|nr:hypothetical protein [Verrucomicrobiales bacterium]